MKRLFSFVNLRVYLCVPLCTFVVKPDTFKHKGTQSDSQSNTKDRLMEY
jgi:hypothetical protein